MSIVTVLELIPLLGVIGLFALPKGSTKLIKQFSIGVSLVDLIISVVMAVRFNAICRVTHMDLKLWN